ncbi:hypothetical protein [Dactylosporangium darangshiense]|uniref:Guanylate cyclase domain-containing protein n=1 Tax=Dactylosporangium darangshiense TaxID=579108 RepID=A0ABP8DHD7_9ACTN
MPMPLPENRLCFVVDIVSYSTRPSVRQVEAQSRVAAVIAAALTRARIAPGHCERQDRGDGQLLLLPIGADPVRTVPALVQGLLAGLAEANRVAALTDRIRLRAALSHGVVRIAATGYVGDCVVEACRIVDAKPLKQALAERPDRDLVVALSAELYRDAVLSPYGDLAPELFCEVNVAEKELSTTAWICLPDRRGPGGAPAGDLAMGPPGPGAGGWLSGAARPWLAGAAGWAIGEEWGDDRDTVAGDRATAPHWQDHHPHHDAWGS